MKVSEALKLELKGEIPCPKCGTIYSIEVIGINLTWAECKSCDLHNTIVLKLWNNAPLISVDLPHFRVKIFSSRFYITSYGAGDMATTYASGLTIDIINIDLLEIDMKWVKNYLAFS